MQFRSFALGLISLCLLAPSPAQATEESFEFWLSPAVETDLDDDTSIELATSARFGSIDDGGNDTYFVRGWIKQRLNDTVSIAGGVEQRAVDGGSDEFRTMQQLSTRHGIVRTRLRFEQRFVENRGGRVGLRLRPRLGIRVPLDSDGRWGAKADAELFWVLRDTKAGGDTGIDRLRTQIGVSYEVSDNFELGLSYIRQHRFESGAPDEVTHVPAVGIDFAF